MSTADDDAAGEQAQYPNYAFLVHSQTSLGQDLPPKVDTAMTARQKRRRTRYVPESLHIPSERYAIFAGNLLLTTATVPKIMLSSRRPIFKIPNQTRASA